MSAARTLDQYQCPYGDSGAPLRDGRRSGGLADLRTPANGRVEVLKVSRDMHTDEEGVAVFKQAIAERDPRD